MQQTAVARYTEVHAKTASPGEILIALYDGLFRFLDGARLFLEQGDKTRASVLISKAHAIVSELYCALDRDKAPELCDNLAGVYGFCLDRLTHANLKSDRQAVKDVMRVLSPLREAWKLAVPKA